MNLRKLRKNAPILPWLLADRLKQRAMMAYYRQIAEIGERTQILNDGSVFNPEGTRSRLRIGKRSIIRGELFVGTHCGKLSIGDDCFLGQFSFIRAWSEGGITIGDRVMMSHAVNILDNDGHSLNPVLRHMHFQAIATMGHPPHVPDVTSEPITIDDDAWIGHSSTIQRGVTIGEGAVVGFGSIVLKNVAPWTVVAGSPAKVIRNLAYARAVADQVKASFRPPLAVIDGQTK